MDPFKTAGAFSWCELMTTDPAAARSFYESLFGWRVDEMSMPGGSYAVVHVGDKPVGGIMSMPPGSEDHPPIWGAYVTVENVDETAARVEELGGSIVMPPTDIPGVGRFCVLRDPQGAVLNAITYSEQE